ALKIYADGTLRLWLSSNGTAWNIAAEVASTLALNANNDYLVSLAFEDTRYVVKIIEYVDENTSLDNAAEYIVVNSSVPIVNGIPFSEGNGNSGNEPFAGSIDLKKSYTIIANNIYWAGALNGFKHQNGHLYYNISDKYIADEIYQNFNIEKCYGIDFENERIFLPRKNKRYLVKEYHNGNAWYELYSDGWLRQVNICYVGYAVSNGWGASDISLLYPYNNTNYTVVMSGSPIYTGSYGTSDYVGERYIDKFTHHFYNASQHPQYYIAEGYTDIPDDLFEYEYICVGNTVQNNAITNVIETIASENDIIPLFFSKYDSSILDDLSFVRADNTWLSGNLYLTAYTRLENQLSSNNPQIKVIREEDMISGQDYSDYFLIRQSTNEFKLPIRTNNRVLVASKKATSEDTTWYNWYSDGWLEQGGQFPIYTNWIDRTINLPKPYIDTSYYVGVTTGHVAHTDAPSVSAKTTYSFHCQPYVDNNGGAWFTCGYGHIPLFEDYTENTHLYFKLNNAVQNLQLMKVS
ncbi:hypothetical protein IJ182_09755, partial [bacterium]|nr:hypothetical protein [bacterium]